MSGKANHSFRSLGPKSSKAAGECLCTYLNRAAPPLLSTLLENWPRKELIAFHTIKYVSKLHADDPEISGQQEFGAGRPHRDAC